ncbi:MAG: hypothetical protein Kow0069_38150 [Promethearchaeota archaeon]
MTKGKKLATSGTALAVLLALAIPSTLASGYFTETFESSEQFQGAWISSDGAAIAEGFAHQGSRSLWLNNTGYARRTLDKGYRSGNLSAWVYVEFGDEWPLNDGEYFWLFGVVGEEEFGGLGVDHVGKIVYRNTESGVLPSKITTYSVPNATWTKLTLNWHAVVGHHVRVSVNDVQIVEQSNLLGRVNEVLLGGANWSAGEAHVHLDDVSFTEESSGGGFDVDGFPPAILGAAGLSATFALVVAGATGPRRKPARP